MDTRIPDTQATTIQGVTKVEPVYYNATEAHTEAIPLVGMPILVSFGTFMGKALLHIVLWIRGLKNPRKAKKHPLFYKDLQQ